MCGLQAAQELQAEIRSKEQELSSLRAASPAAAAAVEAEARQDLRVGPGRRGLGACCRRRAG